MNIDELLNRYASGDRDFGAINLPRANLNQINLQAADLSKASLNKANLGGVNLSRTNLTKADLSEARLRGAHNVQPGQLNKAILMGTEMPDGTIHN